MQAPILPLRRWLAAGFVLLLAAATAQAAPAVVEVVAFAHPPVQSALKPLRDWLGAQGGKLKVIEIDMDSAAGEKRLKEIGIKGHVPVVVLVDGQYRHKRADGSTVEFVSFPSGPGTPPGVTGAWSAVDVEAVIKSRKP
jgi:hypothetical protein